MAGHGREDRERPSRPRFSGNPFVNQTPSFSGNPFVNQPGQSDFSGNPFVITGGCNQ